MVFAREKDGLVEARRLLERQLRDEQMIVERNAVQHAQQARLLCPRGTNYAASPQHSRMMLLSERCLLVCKCVRPPCKKFGAP